MCLLPSIIVRGKNCEARISKPEYICVIFVSKIFKQKIKNCSNPVKNAEAMPLA